MIPRAGALPDPMIGFGVDEYPLQKDEMALDSPWERTGKLIAVRQAFPWPGTLSSEKAMARAAFEMKAAMAAGERAMLTFDVNKMYFEWAKIREQRALLDSARTTMSRMVEQAERGYAAGMGTLADILRAQTERLRMDAMISEMDAMEKAAIAELNICCQLPPDQMTTPPSPLSYEAREFAYDSLLAWSVLGNADYRTADLKIEMARASVRNARKMRYPMLDLSAEVMQRTESGETMKMASGMLGITIPLWARAKQNRFIAERTIENNKAAAERDVAFNNVRLKLTALSARKRSISERIELYRSGIIPAAEQVFEAALSGYTNGKSDFMIVLNSVTQVFAYRRELVGLYADYETTSAELEFVTGRRLF
jgi:outer membrane protein TolC